MPQNWKKIILLLITAASLASVLLTYRMGHPSRLYFDEIYYVPAARALVSGNPDPNWVAPPLGKAFIGEAIRIFGNTSFAWRLPSVLAALLGLWFFFLLTIKIFSQETKPSYLFPELTAFLASLFFLLDGITYVQSRIDMLDMMMTCFLIGAFYFFLTERYFICSLFLGLSFACKWTGAFSFLFFLPMIPCAEGIKKYLRIVLEIYFPAVLLYSLIFIFLGFGYKLFLFGGMLSIIKHFILSQIKMVNFYLKPLGYQPYEASWWKCLLLIRPIWYFYQFHSNQMNGIVMLPNPFLWWPSLLSALFLFFRFSDRTARIILFGILWLILPWALSSRQGFMYYLLPISPFMVLALIYWIRGSKTAVWAALAASLLGFFLYFPLYSNLPISYPYFWSLIWLKTWL